MDINKPVSSAIIFIVILVAGFLFVMPKYKELSRLNNLLVLKQAEYEGKSAYYKKILDALDSLGEKSLQIQKIESSLPEKVSIASLLYFLELRGVENGMTVKSISASQVGLTQATSNKSSASNSTAKQVRNISFSLDLSGSYAGLKNFLKSLEESSRLFQVDNLSFSSIGAGSPVQPKKQLGLYSFKMNIKTQAY